MLEFLNKISYTDAFAIGALIGLIVASIKLVLRKKGFKTSKKSGVEYFIAIILGIIFAFGDDK